jgi:predicted acetyltransferase
MPSLVVRPLSSDEEYTLYSRLADTAFSHPPSEKSLRRWQAYIRQSPDFRSEQMRGVFRDGQLMGGCVVHERLLQMGAARISTGCISGVVIAPDYRKQGAAAVLMQDTIEFARSNNHALLLLDGIAKFYYRYGYTDMFDVTDIEIDRAAILVQTPPPAYTIRPATVEDAPALLDLYKRHYSASTGSFERSLELQTHYLHFARSPIVVALSPQEQIAGYLIYGTDDHANTGRELAADDEKAGLALLQYHAHLLAGNSTLNALSYRLPPDAPLTQWMIDSLEVPDAAQLQSPVNEWSVREVTVHHRFAGWMARLVNYRALLEAILPELRIRWQRSLARWSGDIILNIDGMSCMLRLDGPAVQLMEATNGATYNVDLTPQALVQLVFGYRSLARLTNLAHLPAGARSALSILFPTGHTWIPSTDWF